MAYTIRPATLEDAPHLLRHRAEMFREMGLGDDFSEMERAFHKWLDDMMPKGVFFAWVAECESGDIVAGGGVALLPWPPGPRDHTGIRPYVYSVYTERAHRRQGLARQIMETIHEWCQARGYRTVALEASPDGHALYERMGYVPYDGMRLNLDQGE